MDYHALLENLCCFLRGEYVCEERFHRVRDVARGTMPPRFKKVRTRELFKRATTRNRAPPPQIN